MAHRFVEMNRAAKGLSHEKINFKRHGRSRRIIMDYQFSYHTPQQNSRRSEKMELASFVLGIIAIATSCLVYTTLICGSLAIVFALLSRGGETTMGPRAKAGLTMGCVGLVIIGLMMLYTVVIANLYYGGLEEMLRETYSSMGIDYDMLFESY